MTGKPTLAIGCSAGANGRVADVSLPRITEATNTASHLKRPAGKGFRPLAIAPTPALK